MMIWNSSLKEEAINLRSLIDRITSLTSFQKANSLVKTSKISKSRSTQEIHLIHRYPGRLCLRICSQLISEGLWSREMMKRTGRTWVRLRIIVCYCHPLRSIGRLFIRNTLWTSRPGASDRLSRKVRLKLEVSSESHNLDWASLKSCNRNRLSWILFIFLRKLKESNLKRDLMVGNWGCLSTATLLLKVSTQMTSSRSKSKKK